MEFGAPSTADGSSAKKVWKGTIAVRVLTAMSVDPLTQTARLIDLGVPALAGLTDAATDRGSSSPT